MTLKATPRIKITKKKFGHMLMEKHKGQVEQSRYSENLYDGNPPAQMTLYYSSEGHCATWMNGEGWEFITTNDEDEGWKCNHCGRHHTSDMTVGHEDEHGKTCPDCWEDHLYNEDEDENISPETFAIVYIKVENPEPQKELLRRPKNPAYDGIKDKLIAKLKPVLGECNPDTWWIDNIHNQWLTGS